MRHNFFSLFDILHASSRLLEFSSCDMKFKLNATTSSSRHDVHGKHVIFRHPSGKTVKLNRGKKKNLAYGINDLSLKNFPIHLRPTFLSSTFILHPACASYISRFFHVFFFFPNPSASRRRKREKVFEICCLNRFENSDIIWNISD